MVASHFRVVHRRVMRLEIVGICAVIACQHFGTQLCAAFPQMREEVSWIWSPEHEAGDVPQTACYFRKTIPLSGQHAGFIEIVADDEYELYVNGRKVAEGTLTPDMVRHDISERLRDGNNLVAIKVTNRNGGDAGVAARIELTSKDGQKRTHGTDATWKTSLRVLPLWNTKTYSDHRWEAAYDLGPYESRRVWSGGDVAAPAETQKQPRSDAPGPKTVSTSVAPAEENLPRFHLPADFQVQHVAGHDETGSLIALAFDEFGQLLVSREGGPLLQIHDSNHNQVPDSARVCCNKVRNCQGIVAISGHVYVVGDGPQGAALYRLTDEDRNGDFESLFALIRFQGAMSEHGPHGLALGPDGMIYMAIGNHTKPAVPFALTSPHQHYYEGDLIPRYEDPLGHAAGIKAPGGGVVRVDLEGRRVELFAGGVRNAYDLAFNRAGELFLHDSDMESDAGTPWHRPTRLLHVTAGSEFGWRSGWGKWPAYFVDSLPGILDTGRGSPTGSLVYDHDAFPAPYRQVLFSSDWSQGEIVAFHLERKGATYTARRETFLQGKPLNVTDIDVGPEGSLYFCTGGRGTRGGIYRVVYTPSAGQVPTTGSGITAAIRQPQLASAWGRQAVSVLRRDMDRAWDAAIRRFVTDPQQLPHERARGLVLMHLVGPPPSDELLVTLARDPDPEVRGQAAYLMGLIGNDITRPRLVSLMADHVPFVRRYACEALARTRQQVSLPAILPLLRSSDRFEAWAARRLLETNESSAWQDAVLAHEDVRVFVQGAMATMIAAPTPPRARTIIHRTTEFARDFVADADFVDLLRVVQLALLRGNLSPDDVSELGTWLADEFPAGNDQINRELVRLLVVMQDSSALARMLEYLQSDAPQEEKIHVATHLRFLTIGWQPSTKLRLLDFLQGARDGDGGKNLARYLDLVGQDFAKSLNAQEQQQVLKQAHQLPTFALTALRALPESRDKEMVPILIELDRRIADSQGPEFDHLRVGIVAVLARGGTPEGMGYLREVYDRDPERRAAVAMGLAQQPDGRNWDYLVRSIPLLDGEPAREVLTKLREVEFAPESSEHIRQVILSGLRLKAEGGMLADALLQHWTGSRPPDAGHTWDTALGAWQRWYEASYPDRPLATLPEETGSNRWTYEDLLTFLNSPEARNGSAQRGAHVYRVAQCAKCHVHGNTGENFGPELTSVAKRFQKREILESIVYPSQVISDQYATSTVVTGHGRSMVGLVMPARTPGNIVIMQASGEKVTLAEEDVEDIFPSRTSAMPEGLLNDLTLKEIADLFAFLMQGADAEVARRPAESTTRQ